MVVLYNECVFFTIKFIKISSYLVIPEGCVRFLVTGFVCQIPVIFHKRGTLTPPAFKPLCSRGNVSLLWDMVALCAAACVNVAEAYPFYGIFWLWH